LRLSRFDAGPGLVCVHAGLLVGEGRDA
jgi:hypothetical protein